MRSLFPAVMTICCKMLEMLLVNASNSLKEVCEGNFLSYTAVIGAVLTTFLREFKLVFTTK